MKSLKLCFESLLDDDDIFYKPKNYKRIIRDWIKDNCETKGKLTISDDFVVDCAGHVSVKDKSITSLTGNLFHWGNIGGNFSCSNCNNLISLERAPKKVGGDFSCIACKKLTSLEGAPKEVGGNFSCTDCKNLKTLKGAPEKIKDYLWCEGCKNLKLTDSDYKKYKILL